MGASTSTMPYHVLQLGLGWGLYVVGRETHKGKKRGAQDKDSSLRGSSEGIRKTHAEGQLRESRKAYQKTQI